MTDREINARQAFSDIRSGMDEAALMEKYKLSRAGLKNLLKELSELGLLETDKDGKLKPPRKKIKVKQFLKDFRSGMADDGLMAKYEISRDGLYLVYRRLIDLKAVRSDELFGEPDLTARAIDPIHVREMERFCLDFELSVHEASHPGNRGVVRDMSEKGVGLSGISCSVGEHKILVIDPDKFMDIEPFLFRAECAWSEIDIITRSRLSGFKIDEISAEDLDRLRQLIGFLSFCQ
ncbi:MAG: hypothetical protein HY912_19155 [Desulfomonile tiedjei]|uniref:PilZ domain-containing protein n=1 Tax=Desulfomonile tiedjei TaxID=2358 RepID=A0A9D6V3W0_9BACT|nr:hypothetical protein [Desulfomonile tiedjei]